jgi:AcrR family transcriptional regulator
MMSSSRTKAGARDTDEVARAGRRRDPNRKQSILDAAAVLVSRRGYAGVSMAEIGAEVGIAASAIYWHFPSKQDLLVALFDQCLDRLRSEQDAALERLGPTWEALTEIARLQIAFAVRERDFARVYYGEADNLPEADRRSLRAKQRAYVAAWAGLLRTLRPELDVSRAESIVHATIGAVQSCLVHRSPLPRAEVEALLLSIALAVLGVAAVPDDPVDEGRAGA